MTDARHPERWLMDKRVQRLTGDQYRGYSMSLMWAVSNRTDGHLTSGDLALVPHFRSEFIGAFLDAGLWDVFDGGWVIAEYMLTQTSRAQLEAAEHARVKEAERKARDRARAKATGNVCSPVDSPADYAGQATARPVIGEVLREVPSEKDELSIEPAYPTDPQAVEWRKKIDSEGISSVAQLAKVAKCTPEQARKMWAAAFPESRAA